MEQLARDGAYRQLLEYDQLKSEHAEERVGSADVLLLVSEKAFLLSFARSSESSVKVPFTSRRPTSTTSAPIITIPVKRRERHRTPTESSGAASSRTFEVDNCTTDAPK